MPSLARLMLLFAILVANALAMRFLPSLGKKPAAAEKPPVAMTAMPTRPDGRASR